MSTLAIIPTYLTTGRDVEVAMKAITTLLETTKRKECDLLVVDDGSPDRTLPDAIGKKAGQLPFMFQAQPENEGFSRTINHGLRQAHREGRDAVLVNADVEFIDKGWLGRMVRQEREDGQGLADVVGAKLLYPNLLIQHGGIFFSLLHRTFEHWYKYAPHDLPEAQRADRVPVTGALQFIRGAALQELGVYDEGFRLGWEDVDWCLRIFEAGRECVYQPAVRAIHHESLFRGRPSPKMQEWQQHSWMHLIQKWSGRGDFTRWVPALA